MTIRSQNSRNLQKLGHIKKNGILPSPLTKTDDKGSASGLNIKKLMKQHNYTNMFLKILGDQLKEVVQTAENIKTTSLKI